MPLIKTQTGLTGVTGNPIRCESNWRPCGSKSLMPSICTKDRLFRGKGSNLLVKLIRGQIKIASGFILMD